MNKGRRIGVAFLGFWLAVAPIIWGRAEPAMQKSLKVNDDGKFKIMIISDIQDSITPVNQTVMLMEAALDAEKPDLVVLGGDNIFGMAPMLFLSKENAKSAIDNLLKPIEDRNIPFCVVMGNHDAEGALSTYEQMERYMAHPLCLAEVGDVPIGVGNYHLAVENQEGRPLFGLWFLDSGNLASKEEGGGYAYVSDEQIHWYEELSSELRRANEGKPLPSLLFQHIPVPEIYDVLMPVSKDTIGAIRGQSSHRDQYFVANSEYVKNGTFDEGPCPPDINNGQFASWQKQGDIMAAFFGHDHRNDFLATWQGIDLVYTPGVGFYSYGNGYKHGVRIVELDETKPDTYATRMVYYSDVLTEEIPPQLRFMGQLVFNVILFSVLSFFLILFAVVVLFYRRGKKRRGQIANQQTKLKSDKLA